MNKLLGMLSSIKGLILITSLVFLIGLGTGSYLTNKLYTMNKITKLEAYIDRQQASHNKTLKNLEQVSSEKLVLLEDKLKTAEISLHVKDNRECDISSVTERLLDIARTGVSISARAANEGTSTTPSITQRQQIDSCRKDGLAYRELLVDYNGLKRFIEDNWKGK